MRRDYFIISSKLGQTFGLTIEDGEYHVKTSLGVISTSNLEEFRKFAIHNELKLESLELSRDAIRQYNFYLGRIKAQLSNEEDERRFDALRDYIDDKSDYEPVEIEEC